MFKRERVMTVEEFLNDNKNDKKIDKKHMARLATISMAFILNPTQIFALGSLEVSLSLIKLACMGILLLAPLISLTLTYIKASKRAIEYDPEWENENTIVDYTETKIDREWYK